MSLSVFPTLDLECESCDARFETELVEAGIARQITCPACGAVGDTPADLELLDAFEKVPTVLSYAQGTFRFNALHVTEKQRVPRIAAPAREDETHTWAEQRYQDAVDACRQGRWPEAFKAALDARDEVEAARRLVRSAHCPQCRKGFPETPNGSTVDQARYFRGRCPDCDVPLRLGAT